MITCGIDASSSCTGLFIFDDLNPIYYTKIRPQHKNEGWEYNICDIISQIIPILKEYKVEKIWAENVPEYANKGTRGGMMLKPLIILGGMHEALYMKLGIELGYDIEFVDVYEWRGKLEFLKGARAREDQKEKAVKFINDKFGLDLYFVKDSKTIKNDDDIAEAGCIVWSQIMPQVEHKSFGKKRKEVDS